MESWNVNKDIAMVLGNTDTAQAVRKYSDDEDKVGCGNAPSPGGMQKRDRDR